MQHFSLYPIGHVLQGQQIQYLYMCRCYEYSRILKAKEKKEYVKKTKQFFVKLKRKKKRKKENTSTQNYTRN